MFYKKKACENLINFFERKTLNKLLYNIFQSNDILLSLLKYDEMSKPSVKSLFIIFSSY